MYTTIKIISTTVEVPGEVARDIEEIDAYIRYEEFYEYDIDEAAPIAKDEFYLVDSKGNKNDNTDYEIMELLEIYDESVSFIKE